MARSKESTDRIRKIWAEAKLKKEAGGSGQADETAAVPAGQDNPAADGAHGQAGRKRRPPRKKGAPQNLGGLKDEMEALRDERDFFRAEISRMEERISKLAKEKSPGKRSELDLIGEIENDLHKRYAVIKNIKDRLLQVQKKAAESEEAVKARDGEISGLADAISQLKKMNADQKRHLYEMRESVRKKEAEAGHLKGEVSDLEDRIAGLEDIVKAKEEEGTSIVAEKDSMIGDLQRAMEELQDSIRKKDGEAGGLKGRIAELEETLQKKESEISSVKKSMAALKKGAARSEGAAAEKDSEIAKLKADAAWLKELNEAMKSRKKSEQKKEKAAAEAVRLAAEKDAKIEKLKSEVSSLRKLAITQKQYIDGLEGSE